MANGEWGMPREKPQRTPQGMLRQAPPGMH